MNSTINIIDGGSNTRLIQEPEISCHSDYLRLHRENLSPQDFEQLLSFIAADHVVEMDRRWSAGGNARVYDNKVIGINGFVGGFSLNDDGSIACMVQCSGQYFTQLNSVDYWRLTQGLKHRFNMKCSRVDYAIDDYTYFIIPVADMEEAVNSGNHFGFRKVGMSANGYRFLDMQETRYFGSRESGKFTRIYDHDGECLRHETEFKREYAQAAFDLIADLNREDFKYEKDGVVAYRDYDGCEFACFGSIIARRMGGAVLRAIDFRDRSVYKDRSRVGSRDSKRLGFYQQYIDKVGAVDVQIKAKEVVKSLHKTFEWVKRQCAPTLAMFREGLGRHEFNLFMREIVSEGEQRMDNVKGMWAKEIRRKPTCFRVT